MTVPENPRTCPSCGSTLDEVESTHFRDWDCGNRSVPTRLLGPLIIIAGFVMLTCIPFLGLLLVLAGGYLLVGNAKTCRTLRCPDCGKRQEFPTAGPGDTNGES